MYGERRMATEHYSRCQNKIVRQAATYNVSIENVTDHYWFDERSVQTQMFGEDQRVFDRHNRYGNEGKQTQLAKVSLSWNRK